MQIEMEYFNIYYYCNIASNIIESGNTEYLMLLSEFSHPYMEECPENFSKDSALIQFCRWSAMCIMKEDMEIELQKLKENIVRSKESDTERFYKAFWSEGTYYTFEVERAIKHYYNKVPRFLDWLEEHTNEMLENAFEEYLFELWVTDKYEDTINQIAKEMFYIIFQNRNFLFEFNRYMSCTHKYKFEHTYVPQWVKRAIFFRDRGKCVLCNKDLSGTWDVVEQNSIHYDHIISLENGGLNDISNIQLLCKKCNLNKGSRCGTSINYQNWYDMN